MSSSGIDAYLNSTSQQLYRRAKGIIPGGTQLLSKRPEMFAPEVWPAYYSKAKGCRVWDLDDREYVDMSIMGIGANVLGYADDDVDKAVMDAVKNGSSSSLNCAEDVILAEILIELHPWAEMVRYARSGGEAMAVAVRIARAATGRDVVLFSGYHGWMDWYLAANLGQTDALDGQLMPGLDPKGVPKGLRGSVLPFTFDAIDGLPGAIAGMEDKIAAVVVEPARGEEAPVETLEKIRTLCDRIGAVLIYDEITSGFRMCAGGIHLRYGINPDMAVFAKGIANGYAMAAIIGNKPAMEGAQSTFISSTNWTERIGPVAAIATIQKYINHNAAEHIIRIGKNIKDVWRKAALENGIDISISGIPSLPMFTFDDENGRKRMTFFIIEMLKKGFLAFRQFKPSLSHTDKDVIRYETAVNEVFKTMKNKNPLELLSTPVAHSGFHRLTRE
jgi:glutamate-1-semialdehyde 2,1-aminomutase